MVECKKSFFWRSQRDGTSFIGLDLAVWLYKYGGRYAIKVLLLIIATIVYLSVPRARFYSQDYLKRIRQTAIDNDITLPPNNVWRHIYRFVEAVLERVLAWHGLLNYADLEAVDNSIVRMQTQLASPTGAVIVGAHVGSIEMLRAIMKVSTAKIRRVNILIETTGNQRFLEYLKKVNADSATDFFPVDDITPATAIELHERVTNGEWVVILADRLPHPKARALKVPFLGSTVLLPEGPWLLALLLKAPVFALFGVKSGRKLKVYFKDLGRVEAPRREREAVFTQKATALAQLMTEILFQAPLDWFNFYGFFEGSPQVKPKADEVKSNAGQAPKNSESRED